MLFEREPIFSYYIIFECEVMRCDISTTDGGEFVTYISEQTTPIENRENALIYWLDYRGGAGFRPRNPKRGFYILDPAEDNILQSEVAAIFARGRIIYQDVKLLERVARYIATAQKLSFRSEKD